jgi:hypothetical protein
MAHRYVARVRMPSRRRPERRQAVRGVVDKPDVSTRLIRLPDATDAVFLDRSGRRGRRLRRFAYAVVVIAFVLLGLLWLSQGADLLGLAGLG